MDELNPIQPESLPWRTLLWFSALLGLCYWEVVVNIAGTWTRSQEMAHGFAVPVVVAYVLFSRRREILAAPVRTSYWGLTLIVLAALLACLGALAAEIFTERIALLLSVFGLVLYLNGPVRTRALAFPLLLLLFALPIPGAVYKMVTFPLQLLATKCAEKLIEGCGFIVLRQGNILELAGQKVSVAEACNGLRSLFSLSFFAVVYAWLAHPKAWMRWALLVLAIPVSVAANALRVSLTAILGEYNQALAQGLMHEFCGWVVLGLAIVLVVGLEKGLARVAGRR